MAGINVTPANIGSPRRPVRWYNYEALQISKGLGRLARAELHLRLSQHQSVNDFSKSKENPAGALDDTATDELVDSVELHKHSSVTHPAKMGIKEFR